MTGDRVMRARPVSTGPWRPARAGLRRRGPTARLRHGAPRRRRERASGGAETEDPQNGGRRPRRRAPLSLQRWLHTPVACTGPAALAAQFCSLQRSTHPCSLQRSYSPPAGRTLLPAALSARGAGSACGACSCRDQWAAAHLSAASGRGVAACHLGRNFKSGAAMIGAESPEACRSSRPSPWSRAASCAEGAL